MVGHVGHKLDHLPMASMDLISRGSCDRFSLIKIGLLSNPLEIGFCLAIQKSESISSISQSIFASKALSFSTSCDSVIPPSQHVLRFDAKIRPEHRISGQPPFGSQSQLTAWRYTYPSENYESVGMMKFPTEWENKIHVPNHQPVE